MGRRETYRAQLYQAALENLSYFKPEATMAACPICLRERPVEQMSVGHVFPKGTIGDRTFHVVECAQCNPKLGSAVDEDFGNFASLARFNCGELPAKDAVDLMSRKVQKAHFNGNPAHIFPTHNLGSISMDIRPFHEFHLVNGEQIQFGIQTQLNLDFNRVTAALIHSAMLFQFAVYGYDYIITTNLHVFRRYLQLVQQSPWPEKRVNALSSRVSLCIRAVQGENSPRPPPLFWIEAGKVICHAIQIPILSSGGLLVLMPGPGVHAWRLYRGLLKTGPDWRRGKLLAAEFKGSLKAERDQGVRRRNVVLPLWNRVQATIDQLGAI